MAISRTLIGLTLVIISLALVATGVGLFLGQGQSFSFTSPRGEAVQMYGIGLYRFDTLLTGAGFQGQDFATLVLGVPLLIVALALYARGSPRGGVLLLAVLAFFLYVYISMAFNAAYNSLFLVYVVLMSASFFALVRAYTSMDLVALIAEAAARLPRRGPALLLIGGGALTFFVWISPIAAALAQGKTPELLGPYTTFVTYALDLGIITPACIIAGVQMLRRKDAGYTIGIPLLGIIVMLLPVIVASTVSQVRAGFQFTIGQMIGPIAGFGVIGALAIWAIAAILGALPPRSAVPARKR